MLDFYFNKKILVTGHTGFKGSWLSLMLLSTGAKVCGYALPPYTERDNYVLSNVSKRITAAGGSDITADIRDFENLKAAFDEFRPEIVLHLAAQPLVLTSYKEPAMTFETNIMGTVNILECIRTCDSVKSAVIITTDKVYENTESENGYTESDKLSGYDPYSASKACTEHIVSSYSNSFLRNEGKLVATARAGNVIGGGDWADNRIIPDCIRALETGDEITLRNPDAVRPWQHVLEPLTGYLMLAQRLYLGEEALCGAWNFGPDDDSMIRVGDIVDLVIKSFGRGDWTSPADTNKLHETKILKLNCDKAKSVLHWHPALTISETVELTAEWYKDYKNSAYDICAGQIKNYLLNTPNGRQL